jgi:hypothetical protein
LEGREGKGVTLYGAGVVDVCSAKTNIHVWLPIEDAHIVGPYEMLAEVSCREKVIKRVLNFRNL